MPSVWVEGPLESAQAFWLSLESQEAVLSSVAKQMDRVHWGGNITVKLLCKKKKACLIYTECLVPAGLELSLGGRKAKNSCTC